MEPRYDVIAAMDACVDLILTGDVVPSFGQVEKLIDGYFLEIGGSACLFGCQCAKLGLQSAGIGTVGKDTFGAVVLQRLKEAGVDTSCIEVDPGVPTGLGVALCRGDGDRAILTVSGTIDRVDPEKLRSGLRRARHLHIASFYLLRGMRPHWLDIVREAKRLGLTVSLDTNWDPEQKWDGVEQLMPYLDVIFPNEQELCRLSGRTDITAGARMLSREIPLVVVKLGAQGAMAVGGDGRMESLPARPAKIADTIGAGDSFDAGFLYGLLRGRELRRCLQMGVFCATESLQRPGGYAGQPVLAALAEQERAPV